MGGSRGKNRYIAVLLLQTVALCSLRPDMYSMYKLKDELDLRMTPRTSGKTGKPWKLEMGVTAADSQM